ncbi:MULTISPECIES: S8/S53 family peptidase [unclassified Delftia]|uniref:S8/S53 family peptidase n=1 Tax=unclassified Delftia TaxID=2613839 RepID=UPI0019025964|nr:MULTISPECIES: S8/S53 family peptidase [unclassified Delftia]MBK0114475.1 S8/S53 family peptidase [Delftia sp. S65]MBK0119389.1 S8/S53 family peptidase [Delftia sp. S67]MBK0132206.1 S8/S53 family peptidase [Delftia sp. S66]
MQSSIFSAFIFSLANPVHAQDVEKLHLIHLNPFVIQAHEEEAIAAGFNSFAPNTLLQNNNIFLINKNPEEEKEEPSIGIEKTKLQIFDILSVKNSSVFKKSSSINFKNKAALIPAFYANLTKDDAQLIRNSGYAISVDLVQNHNLELQLSNYYDINSAGEITPWGKQAVNANDALSTNNVYYIIDSPYYNNPLGSEINLIHSESTGSDNSSHASYILSLVGGRANNAKIKGINPDQPIIHFGMKLDPVDVLVSMPERIHRAASLAEQRGEFSTLNLSMNLRAINAEDNFMNSNSIVGRALRRASSRLFITQSAGNHDQNACLAAFNYGYNHDPFDGIMVIGGTNRFGERYQTKQYPYPWDEIKASSYGPCVEAWAPGGDITSTLIDGTLFSLSGTSFAAPIVSAIAGRYGGKYTRPIEREAYIRNNLVFTGKYEGASDSNLPIKLVKYTPPWQQNIPEVLPVSGIYSNTSTSNLSRLTDGRFFDNINWSAGRNWGSVVLDLGSSRNLAGIRLMIRSSSDGGRIDFAVHGGNSLNTTGPGSPSVSPNPIAYKTIHDQYDLIPYYIPISGNYRYVMIEANNYSSWLAYSEIEVYGK